MTIQPFTVPLSQPVSASANSAAGTPKSSDSTSTGGASETSANYMQLLIAELQAQDPTSPLDPNQMTAQIVSLNQLDQLIQIRQLLQGIGT